MENGLQEEIAASEDRTHDLRIMRPTRYQLRYSRLAVNSLLSTIHLNQPILLTSFLCSNANNRIKAISALL